MYLRVPQPDWASLAGGEQEALWIAARDRKIAFAAELGPQVFNLATQLEAADALFRCSPEVLKAIPEAGWWFLDLIGLTPKTISGIPNRLSSFGLTASPETIADNLAQGRLLGKQTRVLKSLTDENLKGFSGLVNSDLDQLFPADTRHLNLAITVVVATRGAAIQGQVQNLAGDDAVDLLKTLLVAGMAKRGVGVEVGMDDGSWQEYAPELNLLKRPKIRFGGRLVCELLPGGNHADIRVTLNGVVILVGEVKGRKDLSNIWESWIPQVSNHLRTWAMEHPDAPRVLFGTTFTQEMIDGISGGGTQHAGLQVHHANGMLNGAFNLSKIAENDPGQVHAFDQVLDNIHALLIQQSGQGA